MSTQIDLMSMTLAELRALRRQIEGEIANREATERSERIAARLTPIDTPNGIAPSIANRFAGGFYSERMSTGTMRGLYGKTKSGVIYRWSAFNKAWERL